MDAFKATKKKKDGDVFYATDKKSYDSGIIYKWQRDAEISGKAVDSYTRKIKNKEYLSSEDLDSYRRALDSYISSSEKLRAIGNYTNEEKRNWTSFVESLNSNYDSISSYYRSFQDADVFNAYQTFDLNNYNNDQRLLSLYRKELEDIGFFEDIVDSAKSGIAAVMSGEKAPTRTRKQILEELIASIEDRNAKYLGIVDPDEYARLKEIENAPAWQKLLATGGDLANEGLHAITNAFEDTVEFIPRVGLGLADMVAGRSPTAFRSWIDEKTEELDYDWASETHSMDDDTLARLSYLSKVPEVQGAVKDVISGVGNMAPAIAATAVTGNPAVGSALFFGGSAGSAAEEASLAGARPSMAAQYGAAVGGLETLTEKIGGSVFGEPTDLASTWLGRNLIKSGADEYVSKGLGKAAYTVASEGFEETIMDVVAPGVKAAFDIGDSRERYFGEKWKEGWGEVLKGLPETFAVGGTVGMVIEGFHTGGRAISNVVSGAKNGGGIKGGAAFNRIATEMDYISDVVGSMEAVRQANIPQEKKNAYALRANESISKSLDVISKNMQSISSEQRAAAFKNAPILNSYLNEDGTIKAEITEEIAASVKAAKDSSAVIERGKTVARVESFDGLEEDQIREKIGKRLSTRVGDRALRSEIADIMTNVVQGRRVSNSDIKKVTQNSYALKVLNDYLGTDFDAKTSAKDIRVAVAKKINDYSPTAQAKLYAAVLDLGENGTEGLIMVAQDVKGGDIGDVAQAFNVLYRAGVQGKEITAVENARVSALSPMGRLYAYRTGVVDGLLERGKAKEGAIPSGNVENSDEFTHNSIHPAGTAVGRTNPEFIDEKKVKEAQAKVDAARKSDGKKKKGAVIYDGDRSKLSDMQKKSLDVLDKVAEALGVTFRIYKSESVNGKFVYEKPNGVKTSANGWYDTKTGEIWLDINAGLNGEGTLIFTAAHELTHFIKQWSPAKFKIFADFLIEQYGERGISIDELVQRRIDKKKKNGEDIDPDTAYEEVIADSCETFLRDSNAAERIAELNQKDASLAQKIKRFLRDMLKRLRELMKGMDPDSLEGKMVAEMTGSLEQLHKLWTDALADAGEAYSGADNINAKSNSDIKYAERDYPIDSNVQKTVNNALSTTSSIMHELGDITAAQNNAINRLVNQTKNDLYRGKFTGGKHLFSDNTIKHIVREHGDFLREGLRAQLPMTAEDIARHLSAVKDNKVPSSTKASKTNRGTPSILTSYEVNGYTLYAEEIKKSPGKNLPSDLIGHTMYKAPTLATAHFYATSAQTQPKRQSVVLCNYYTPNSTNLSTGNFIQNSNGLPEQLSYISVNGVAKQDPRSGGLIALSSNASNFTDTAGKIEQGYVRCNKPFYISDDNRVFSNSDTNVAEKINELKNQGYDCFIFEKSPGDNYMVAVVNKAQIIKDEPEVVESGEMHSDRDYDAPTNREILANLLETEDMSPSEKGFLTKYKNKISQIEANEAEISSMESELKELRKAGKKDSARAITLEGKIDARRKEIARDENMILNLESTNSIKRLLKREKDAAYAEGMLAGQMAQGKDDAAKLRRAEERLAEQKRKDGETLAEYKKRVAEREAEIKQKNREKLAEQRERARENLDAQAKRYQESRKKATEGRHKTAMRHKIADVVSELDKLLRKGTKERNVKIGLQDAVAAALEAFDINADSVARYEKTLADIDARIAAATDPIEIEALRALREKKQRRSDMLSDKLQRMKKAYEDIHNGRDDNNYPQYYKAEAEIIENRIAEVMEKVGDTSISEMSLEQLEAVYDMYRMVLTTVQNANKVFKNGKLADLTADATDMTSELQRIKKLAEERLKAGDDIRGFVWNELTPYYAFNRIGSETLMSYYEELIHGQDVYARDLLEAQSFAEATRKKHGYGKWKLDQVHSFKDKDGRDFRLTLRHMMSIYAYSKREQAFDHMEKGGFFFNNKETFRKKGGVLSFIASNESGYKVDTRIFAQIKGALTAEQIAYVDEMQAYLTKMGEKGNEVTRVMWGIDIFKEAVYFPLKSKEDFIYQANTPAETSSLKNDGMTKETKPHASNPIVLESFDDVWANHVEKMSKYHGFVIPIDNLNKLVNYGTWIEGKKITPGMSDAERYDALKDRVLSLSAKANNDALVKAQEKLGLSDDDIEYSKYGDKKRLFKKLGDEFSIYQKYSNEDIHLDFTFSKGNMGESVSKQGRNFLQMAKMLTCLDEIVDNAIGIEVHNRNQDGYKADNTLENVYVLASSFVDGENIVPVKLEIKKFSDKENTLYVAIALESIKTDGIVKQEVAEDGVAQQYSPPSNISIAQFFEKINIADKSFLKYIPDGFLNAEQIEAKKQALEKDGVKYSPSSASDLEGFSMGSHSISTMLEARFGPGVNEYLTTFIKDLNGAKKQDGGLLGGAFNLLSKFKKTSVAASLSVAVQQPTAIIRALSEIDARYFVGMPKPEILNRKWERMKKYAPIVILKDIGGFDAGSGRQITEWLNADTKRGVDKAMNKADDLTMYGAALGDRIGWASIWTAVEREVKAKQKLEYGSEAFYEAVGKRFTEVIVKTQVYDSTLSRSGFMRGKDGLMKMATAFMGEPTLSVNMMADAILQAKRGKIKKAKAVRVIASVYVATVAASVIKSLIYALRDDDEDESYAEKYLQALGSNIIWDTLALNMIPFVRDAVSIFTGWEIERADMALIQDLYDSYKSLGSETKDPWRKVEDFVGALAAFVGIPAKNLIRTGREIRNAVINITDGIEGGDLGGAFIEGITGKEAGKRESMYNALISGNPERIEIYRDSYDSEDKYLSAVKQALREYDPRVQRAVEGALSGSYGIYNEMKDAVKAEKHFDVKTVNNAFADEKEYVLGKLNDARKARRDGNSEEFDKIVQKLIERGYSEEFVRKKLK